MPRPVPPRLAAAVAALVLVVCPPVAARADEALVPIVVTAGSERGGDVVLEDHVGTHVRIGGRTLERRDVTLADVLAQEAGVQRRTSGGFGSFASVTVRAASPAQTSVLLDGVRLNSAGDAVVDLSTLDMLALGAIDVYRGVTPLQFGQGAIGGAVNLVTPRVAAGERLTRVGLGAASFGTRRAELAHRGRHGRWDTVATLGATESDNDYPFVDGNGTPLNAADDRRERRENAGARRVGLLAKVGTRHGEDARTDLLLQSSERDLGVPEWRNARDNVARFDTTATQLQLTHERRGIGAWDSAHTLFVHAQDDRFEDRESQVGLGAQDTLTRTASAGLDSYWTRPLGAGTFGAKAELRRETLAGRERLGSTPDVDAQRYAALASAQWARYALDGRLVLVPALRLQTNDDRVEDARRGGARARRSGLLLPELGARFDASERLALHASVGRYAREPAFSELFVDRGLVLGNPDLAAERGVNADVGLEWSDGESLEAAAAVFASAREELIVTVYDSRGVGRAINTGRARILGLELSGAWAPDAAWRLSGNATLQDAANLSDDPVLDGRQLPGEARVQLHAALHYRASARWRLRLEADATRERFYDQANKRPARDSTLANLGVDYERGRWRAALAVDNLGDRNVEDFNGFPRPGRAISLHVSLTL